MYGSSSRLWISSGLPAKKKKPDCCPERHGTLLSRAKSSRAVTLVSWLTQNIKNKQAGNLWIFRQTRHREREFSKMSFLWLPCGTRRENRENVFLFAHAPTLNWLWQVSEPRKWSFYCLPIGEQRLASEAGNRSHLLHFCYFIFIHNINGGVVGLGRKDQPSGPSVRWRELSGDERCGVEKQLSDFPK